MGSSDNERSQRPTRRGKSSNAKIICRMPDRHVNYTFGRNTNNYKNEWN